MNTISSQKTHFTNIFLWNGILDSIRTFVAFKSYLDIFFSFFDRTFSSYNERRQKRHFWTTYLATSYCPCIYWMPPWVFMSATIRLWCKYETTYQLQEACLLHWCMQVKTRKYSFFPIVRQYDGFVYLSKFYLRSFK